MKTDKILATATMWKCLLSKLSLCNCWVRLVMTAVTHCVRTWCWISLNHKVTLSPHKANKCSLSYSSRKVHWLSASHLERTFRTLLHLVSTGDVSVCPVTNDRLESLFCVHTKTSVQPFQARCQDTLVDFSPLIFKGFKFSKPFLSQEEWFK